MSSAVLLRLPAGKGPTTSNGRGPSDASLYPFDIYGAKSGGNGCAKVEWVMPSGLNMFSSIYSLNGRPETRSTMYPARVAP